MHVPLRLIRLVVLARLRSAGWAPWLLALGWLLFASLQEPLLFRRYGIYLVEDAAWTAGLVVLVVLLLSERRLPRRYGAACNLLIVAAVAVLQALGGYLVDRSAWPPSVADRLLDGLGFFVAWSPLALTLSRNMGDGLLPKLMVLCALMMGSMLAVALRSSPDSFVIISSVCAFSAAACWSCGVVGKT